MPTARVLPDWNMRIKYGRAEPYRYYGVALGVFDRLEFSGQFTEISTITPFRGYNYGYEKNRSAGGRLVLVMEKDWLPQIAIGAYDPIGTLNFPFRYLVASKMFGPMDFTLGLGQGLLGGENYREISKGNSNEQFDTSFLFSNPFRPTKIFGGLEYHFSPKLTVAAEYSSLKYEEMYGSPQKAEYPINFGFKYRPLDNIVLQGGYMRGQELALGLSAEMPLTPEGILPWKKEDPYQANEQKKWQAYTANNDELAELLVKELQNDGFGGVAVAVRDDALWIEARNTKYLSDAKALGRIATIAETVCPKRIETFYTNLTQQGQIRESLKANRNDLAAFQESKIDREGFLTFAELDQFGSRHFNEFFRQAAPSSLQRAAYSRFDFEIVPRVRTFLNNKTNFFTTKVVLRPRLTFYPWRNGSLISEAELTLYNEWDRLDFAPLEKNAVRTDVVLYERNSKPRISQLAFNQFLDLPYNVLGRFSGGIFESAYAGVGGEIFRFFYEGRFGIGLESEAVRKRALEDNFSLHDTVTKTFDTYYLNLYGQIWPEMGLEAGLKIGKFLAGDTGFSLDLRRSFRYFTVGAWYTDTDSNNLTSEKNRGNREKGVYIRVPFSVFTDRDLRGHLLYAFSSFTRDPGQRVSQPATLYPLDPFSSVNYLKRSLDDMRKR